MREKVIDAILGCIVGGAIGDAAGASFEGKSVGPTEPSLLDTDWRLTDDTQLTLATCEAITAAENPDPALIAASFLRWFRARRLSGLGASTLKALREMEVGGHWALTGRKGERAAGNGAAMRIAPLTFCLDLRTEQSRRLIRDVCRITHHHDEAYVGALAVVLAIRAGLESGLSLEGIVSRLPETSVRDRLAGYAALASTVTLAEAARRYGMSGYVVESVPFALFAASRVAELGFAGIVEKVIAAGGDTDTNASLAGQVAGTALGFGKLPKDLLAKLPQAELVLGIARIFAEKMVSRVEGLLAMEPRRAT